MNSAIGRYLVAVSRQKAAEEAVTLATVAADAAQREVAHAVAELERLGIPRPCLACTRATGPRHQSASRRRIGARP